MLPLWISIRVWTALTNLDIMIYDATFAGECFVWNCRFGDRAGAASESGISLRARAGRGIKFGRRPEDDRENTTSSKHWSATLTCVQATPAEASKNAKGFRQSSPRQNSVHRKREIKTTGQSLEKWHHASGRSARHPEGRLRNNLIIHGILEILIMPKANARYLKILQSSICITCIAIYFMNKN